MKRRRKRRLGAQQEGSNNARFEHHESATEFLTVLLSTMASTSGRVSAFTSLMASGRTAVTMLLRASWENGRWQGGARGGREKVERRGAQAAGDC